MPLLLAPLAYVLLGSVGLGGSIAAVNNFFEDEPTGIDKALPSTMSMVKIAILAACAWFAWKFYKGMKPKRGRK